MPTKPYLIHTTTDNVNIYIDQGSKTQYDFVVRYQEPGKRIRTPRHIHLIIDLYLKRAFNDTLTTQLVECMIDDVILKIQSVVTYPPTLQVFSPSRVDDFQALNGYGEYSVEFLLVTTELIMIQEKTNYPDGKMNLVLFQKFRDKADIFSVVSAATFR